MSRESRTHALGRARWRQLAGYVDAHGRHRELVTSAASAGSLLVVDRDVDTGADCRLLAHLAHDEPPENAALICADYLDRDRSESRRCRALADEDAELVPFADVSRPPLVPERCDHAGRSYAIFFAPSRMSIPELRWGWREGSATEGDANVASLREVVAWFESYEPLCSTTEHALARHATDSEVSCTVLRSELRRVRESPIVLNRRLREVVLARVAACGPSMSEIARAATAAKKKRTIAHFPNIAT